MKDIYFDSIMLIERLHRLFLEVMKIELDRMRIHDINNIQCFILYNIGKNKLTVGEISNRGYYLGSNVTYNLKKMLEYDYICQSQSTLDKRSSLIKLSNKGMDLFERMDQTLETHVQNMSHNGIVQQDMRSVKSVLQKLESFWSFNVMHGIRF